MIEIRKNNVLIPIDIWNELKKDSYIKEILEVIEDSELLEKAKRESKGKIDLDDYIRERNKKEEVNFSNRKPKSQKNQVRCLK